MTRRDTDAVMLYVHWLHHLIILLLYCGIPLSCIYSFEPSSSSSLPSSSFGNEPPSYANDAVYGKRPYVNISGDIKLGGLVAIYDAGGQVYKSCHFRRPTSFTNVLNGSRNAIIVKNNYFWKSEH